MVDIRLLETPQELAVVEELQRLIWPGDETEILPVHIFRAAVHNGGLVLGAYRGDQLVGFVFGFPGVDLSSGRPRLTHASHMAGVHPEFRDAGLGYLLKRAQWQMVRKQGVERITWTYDPLQSRNANLNIAKLGAVCNTYIPNYYGEMRDGLNVGMPSDRFQVDWWVNTNRVQRRLSRHEPAKLDLAHYLAADTPYANHTQLTPEGLIVPLKSSPPPERAPLVLVEIPADILALKRSDPNLAVRWSNHIRALFIRYFSDSYLVTDFVYVPGTYPRSFYVLSHGEATF
jgi:predicted GNAT superfamily acetyltransferase